MDSVSETVDLPEDYLLRAEQFSHEDGSFDLNVCLSLPQSSAEKIIKIGEQLSTDRQLFSVDGVARIPHLTLMMARFQRDVVQALSGRLEQLAAFEFAEEGPVVCSSYGITVSANRYVEVGIAKSDRLRRLQWGVRNAVADLMLRTSLDGDQSLSASEALNVEIHGYKLFGDQFRPHVTLAAYAPRSSIPVPLIDDVDGLSFVAKSLSLAVSDRHGSVRCVLASTPFST